MKLVSRYDKILARIIFIGITIRLFLFGAVIAGVQLPDSGADATNFLHLSRSGNINIIFGDGSYYPLLLHIVSKYTLSVELTYVIFNLISFIGTAIYAFKLAAYVHSISAGRLAALIVSVYPTLILYSVISLRECLLTFLLTFGSYHFILLMRHHKLSHLMLWVISVVAAVGLLMPIAIIWTSVTVYTFVRVMLYGGFSFWGRLLTLFASLAVFLALCTSDLSKVSLPYLGNASPVEILEKARDRIDKPSNANTVYMDIGIHNNFEDMSLILVKRVFYFLTSPSPSDGFSGIMAFGILESSLFILLVATVMCATALNDASEIRILSFLLFIYVAMWGVSTDNAGSAIRHRSKIIPIMAIIGVGSITYVAANMQRTFLNGQGNKE